MYRIECAGLSDKGTIKDINEDAFLYRITDVGGSAAGIFTVSDGVGGLQKGEIASSVAVSNLKDWWENEFKSNYYDENYIFNSLIQTIKKINLDLINYGKGQNIKIGATLSILLIYKESGIIFHTGDSRIYRISNILGKYSIKQLTQDHSCVREKQTSNGTIKKSYLTECIGNKENFEIYKTKFEINKNDIFVLCSDGIYKTNENKSICKIVKKNRNDAKKISVELVKLSIQNGEKDNITAVTLKII